MEKWKVFNKYITKNKDYYFKENYEISNTGKIRNIKTKKEISYCEDHINKNGKFHRRTRIYSIDGSRPHIIIARAVAMYFIDTNENIRNLEVDHINENISDDRVENLQWCLPTENKKFNKRNSSHNTIIENIK